MRESDIQAILAQYYREEHGATVMREVGTPVGRVDLLVTGRDGRKTLIETKERSGIKGAIGQVLNYRKYIPDCDEYTVISFERDLRPSQERSREFSKYAHFDIKLYDILQIVPIEYIRKWQTIQTGANLNLSSSSKNSERESPKSQLPVTYLGHDLQQLDVAKLNGTILDEIMW